jgi:dihydroorotate dehydrogenase
LAVADLSVTLGPLDLKNPVIAASSEFTMTDAGIQGCLDAGAAAVVAKSVNESPAAARQLDTADYVLLRPDWSTGSWRRPAAGDSLFNRSGLGQTPLDDWLEILHSADARAQAAGAYVVGSITAGDSHATAAIAGRMAEAVRCIELNLGTPHAALAPKDALAKVGGPEEVAAYTKAARAAAGQVPLLVKLSASGGDLVEQARAALAAGATAVEMTGRFQGFLPDLETWEPVLGTPAAIGGGWSLPLSLYWVSACRRALGPQAPLVGTNGARSGLDVARFLLSGARAVEMASAVLMRGPAALADAIAELDRYAAARGLRRLEEMVGVASDRARSYAELEPRQVHRPWERFYNREGGADGRRD